MATEDTAPEHEGQGAHGPALTGHKGGKGLLNGPHREMIIVVCSVVGVGLTYAMLRKGSSSGSSSAQTAAMGYPGSSAVLSSGQVAGFDQAAVAGLQTQLANVSDQVRALSSSGLPSGYGSGAAPAAPQPLAAGLFAPSDSTQFVRYQSGTIAQVQNDGSLFGLNPQQWNTLWAADGKPTPTDVTGSQPTIYTTGGNLATKNAPAGSST